MCILAAARSLKTVVSRVVAYLAAAHLNVDDFQSGSRRAAARRRRWRGRWQWRRGLLDRKIAVGIVMYFVWNKRNLFQQGIDVRFDSDDRIDVLC